MMSDAQISMFDVTKAENTVMFCLFNGERGEHSLSEMGVSQKQMPQLLEKQKNAYSKYIGKTFGDFVCDGIEYDWGTHKQVWSLKCALCGEKTKKENGYQWSRAKTGSMRCQCCKDRKIKEKQAVQKRKADEKQKRQKEVKDEVGKIYGRYKVIECNGFGIGMSRVKCIECGAERTGSTSIKKLREGVYPTCACNTSTKYGEDEYIGVREGHLVSIETNGGFVKCRCDCGRERTVVTTTYFKYHAATSCGDPECPYSNEKQKKANEARKSGKDYELTTEMLLYSSGYKTKRVGKSGDYGVDIIATDTDGTKIAVQCKCNHRSMVGVRAIQEVYAGGRYYGLEHFAVVAYGEVTKNAYKMAKVLGVYISDGKTFDYPNDIKKYVANIIPTIKVPNNYKNRKLYELNGEWKTLADWAFIMGANVDKTRDGLRKGLTLETALAYASSVTRKEYTVKGHTGTLSELCRTFGIVSTNTASYRIKNGWDIEDAVTTGPTVMGRPRKEKSLMEQSSIFDVAH